MELLKTESISKKFGGLTAIDKIDLSINNGEITSIIGPNGAGKTTFFNIISGFYKSDTGKILFMGNDITNYKPDKIAKIGISRTFQNIRLFKEMLVVENVMVGMHINLKSNLFNIILHTPKMIKEETDSFKFALDLINYVGLSGLEYEKAKNLSYGDQRRLEIARALASNPKLLMLDEPAAGLNPKESEELKKFILQIRDEKKCSILLIEHDMNVVMSISDKILVLNYGKKIAFGIPSEISKNEHVINAYLGEEDEEESDGQVI